MNTDLTDLELNNGELARQIEAFAQNIGDTIRDPLLALDGALRVRWANRAFYAQFDTTPDQTEGRVLFELGEGQWDLPALRTLLEEIIPQASHFDDFELAWESPVQGPRALLLNARKLYRPGDHAVLIALAIEDITERQAEAAREAESERDHRIATALQRSLLFLPPEDAFPGVATRTVYQVASDEALVGGDFWDTFAFGQGQVAFVLGDVMGKGLHAAVFTAELKFALRAYVREHHRPARALAQMNAYLCESHRLFGEGLNALGDDDPVCLAVAVLDPATGAGSVSTAGMEPPLIVRADGRAEEAPVSGMPVGVFVHSHYEAATFQMEPGDLLALSTDGITEARRGKEFLGYEGLTRLTLAARHEETLEAMGRAVLDGARAFAGGRLADDACLLLARRL